MHRRDRRPGPASLASALARATTPGSRRRPRGARLSAPGERLPVPSQTARGQRLPRRRAAEQEANGTKGASGRAQTGRELDHGRRAGEPAAAKRPGEAAARRKPIHDQPAREPTALAHAVRARARGDPEPATRQALPRGARLSVNPRPFGTAPRRAGVRTVSGGGGAQEHAALNPPKAPSRGCRQADGRSSSRDRWSRRSPAGGPPGGGAQPDPWSGRGRSPPLALRCRRG